MTGGGVERRTDAGGLARVSFTPTWFGPVELTLSVPGIQHSRIAYTTDATDTRATLSIVSGNSQDGKAGECLAAPFVVRVTDAGGAGVPNVRVNWTLENDCCYGSFASDWSSVEKASTYSDANGQARVSFLPRRLGALRVRAELAGLHARVNFTAYGTFWSSILVMRAGASSMHFGLTPGSVTSPILPKSKMSSVQGRAAFYRLTHIGSAFSPSD